LYAQPCVQPILGSISIHPDLIQDIALF